MSLYDADLSFAKQLALEASQVALERSSRVLAQEKSNRSFVTDLDLDLERMIRDRISSRYPDDALTGEEYSAAGGTGPRRWCIDPIDGTGTLVHGLPMWSISIGLIDDGDPVVGVIALPWAGELFWAARDGGAWLGDKRISATDATIFHEHDNVSISTNAIRVIDPRSIPGRIRDLGSACCELSFVSCGRLRASIFLGEQAHDLAAGVVIATEAGCRFRALGGSDLSAAQFVAGTPVCTPTLIGPPGRLEQLAKQLRLLPPLV